MKLPTLYQPGALALGSLLVLAGCGGSNSPMATSAAPASAANATGATMPPSSMSPSSITMANAKAVAAQALFASDGLTSRPNSNAALVVGASSATSGNGMIDTSMKQLDKVMNLAVISRAVGVNNTLTINCAQGGTATLTTKTANTTQISTGDNISVVANNCADGTDIANGQITIDFNSITGRPTSTSAWNGTMTVNFNNVSLKHGDVTQSANGSIALVYNQTAFRMATFNLTSDSVQLSDARPSGTTERTITGLNSHGSVNGNVFTYGTNFTVSGDFPRIGQGSYTVTTTTDFMQQAGSDPSQGVVKVTASDGTSATVTAVAPSTVNVAVDSNGDGVIDMNMNTTWNELATLIV